MSTLGTIPDSATTSDSYDLSSDLINWEQDTDKVVSDELNTLSKPSNLYRILGSIAGVSALQVYNGERNIQNLAFTSGLMGVSSIVAIQLSKLLSYKGYVDENREEHIILPASMGLYYLMANRSLNLTQLNNAIGLQAIAGGIGSVSTEYLLNTQKPKQ